MTRTYMVLLGPDGDFASLGCTLLLRGGTARELRAAKRVTRFACSIAYNLRLESAFLLETGSDLLLPPLPWPTMPALLPGTRPAARASADDEEQWTRVATTAPERCRPSQPLLSSSLLVDFELPLETGSDRLAVDAEDAFPGVTGGVERIGRSTSTPAVDRKRGFTLKKAKRALSTFGNAEASAGSGNFDNNDDAFQTKSSQRTAALFSPKPALERKLRPRTAAGLYAEDHGEDLLRLRSKLALSPFAQQRIYVSEIWMLKLAHVEDSTDGVDDTDADSIAASADVHAATASQLQPSAAAFSFAQQLKADRKARANDDRASLSAMPKLSSSAVASL